MEIRESLHWRVSDNPLGTSSGQGTQVGAQREEIIRDALDRVQIFNGSWLGDFGLEGINDEKWLLAGTNAGDISSLALGSTDLRLSSRPAIAATCSVMTGSCTPVGSTGAERVPGLMLQLDVALRLAASDTKINLSAFAEFLLSMLAVVETPFRIARGILPVSSYSTGELEGWLDTGRNDFTQLVELNGPGISVIDGYTPRGEVDLHSTLPLVDVRADAYGITSDPARARQQLAVYLIQRIYEFCGYRGFAPKLHELLNDLTGDDTKGN